MLAPEILTSQFGELRQPIQQLTRVQSRSLPEIAAALDSKTRIPACGGTPHAFLWSCRTSERNLYDEH